jgi:hypothetical protein
MNGDVFLALCRQNSTVSGIKNIFRHEAAMILSRCWCFKANQISGTAPVATIIERIVFREE